MYTSINDFEKMWVLECESTKNIFNVITEDTKSKKIAPQMRNLERLAWHITQTLTGLPCEAGILEKDVLRDAPIPQSFSTITNTFLDYSKGIPAMFKKHWKDEDLKQEIPMYGHAFSKSYVLNMLIVHMVHHRAQMTVVMRVLGLKVPGLYGPSQEECVAMGFPAME